MNKGFQKLHFIIINLLLISQIIIGQNSSTEKDTVSTIEIFQKEETVYIENWVTNLVKEAKLDSEIASRFKIVTSYFGLKMKQLGEDPKLTKIEVIHNFNMLIKEQNNELKKILPEEQFISFSDFFNKLSWSVNKRLNQQ